ncbi:MAG TPA: protein kinase, partial [Acidimicrobiales bacterium]|nr:protein kinase [Acidimicrobiales bacterium]
MRGDSAAPAIPQCHGLSALVERASCTLWAADSDLYGGPVAVTVYHQAMDVAVEPAFAAAVDLATRLGAHPHLVDVFASGRLPDGRGYVVTNGGAGRTTAQGLLATSGVTGVEVALRMGVTLAGALETVHRAGVVHGAVAPASVLFGVGGETLLSGGGMSLFDRTTSGTDRTIPYHAPPEVLEEDDLTPATDVYSLASLIYTLLVGEPPHASDGTGAVDSTASLLLRILQMPMPSIQRSDVPPGVEDALRTALSHAPSKRPQHVLELAWAFQEAQRLAGMDVTEPVVVDVAPAAAPRAAGTAGAAGGFAGAGLAGPPGSGGPLDARAAAAAFPPVGAPMAGGVGAPVAGPSVGAPGVTAGVGASFAARSGGGILGGGSQGTTSATGTAGPGAGSAGGLGAVGSGWPGGLDGLAGVGGRTPPGRDGFTTVPAAAGPSGDAPRSGDEGVPGARNDLPGAPSPGGPSTPASDGPGLTRREASGVATPSGGSDRSGGAGEAGGPGAEPAAPGVGSWASALQNLGGFVPQSRAEQDDTADPNRDGPAPRTVAPPIWPGGDPRTGELPATSPGGLGAWFSGASPAPSQAPAPPGPSSSSPDGPPAPAGAGIPPWLPPVTPDAGAPGGASTPSGDALPPQAPAARKSAPSGDAIAPWTPGAGTAGSPSGASSTSADGSPWAPPKDAGPGGPGRPGGTSSGSFGSSGDGVAPWAPAADAGATSPFAPGTPRPGALPSGDAIAPWTPGRPGDPGAGGPSGDRVPPWAPAGADAPGASPAPPGDVPPWASGSAADTTPSAPGTPGVDGTSGTGDLPSGDALPPWAPDGGASGAGLPGSSSAGDALTPWAPDGGASGAGLPGSSPAGDALPPWAPDGGASGAGLP